MGKAYKQWKKKVNPESSNKMIYAVGAGLILLVIVFLTYTIMDEQVSDKKEVMNQTLGYLKHNNSFKDLKILPDQNRVVFVYDDFTRKEREDDLTLAARYAGIKLSNQIKDVEFSVTLCKGKESDERYRGTFKNGKTLRESRLK